MIRYFKYFLPISIPILGMVLLSFNPQEKFFTETEVMSLVVFIHATLLLSVYWAIGFWIPGEVIKTVISVCLGIGAIVAAYVYLSILSFGLLAPTLIPFLLFITLLIRKWSIKY